MSEWVRFLHWRESNTWERAFECLTLTRLKQHTEMAGEDGGNITQEELYATIMGGSMNW